MRRNFRKNSNYVDSKVITFSVLGVLLLATVVFGILMYGKNIDDNVRSGQLSSEQIASLTEKEQESESASTKLGKSIEEAEKENKEKTTTSTENKLPDTPIPVNNIVKEENKTQNSSTNKNGVTAAKQTQKEEIYVSHLSK